MTDAVKMAIEALRPFADAAGHIHPAHPDEATSLDGFPMSDFRRAAETMAALEQAGEPVADDINDLPLALAKARSWHHFGVAWDKLERVSQDELVEQAAAFLISPAPEAPLPTIQRLGQEFDAGEA